MPRPTLIAEFKMPAFGPYAPGSLVLRDMGERESMRYVTHWRNDRVGGHGNGRYLENLEQGLRDLRDRIEAEIRSRLGDGLLAGPYTWEIWGSHKDEGNDDCVVGDTVDDLGAAFEQMRSWQTMKADDFAYACIETPNGRIFQQVNPNHVPCEDELDIDRSEAAMQYGMAFGTRGRNEVMGEDVDEAPVPRI